MSAPRNISERERGREKGRWVDSSLLSAARSSSVILSAGSYSRNLFRIITTPWNDYPLKCYFVNDIFTVIGDICDANAWRTSDLYSFYCPLGIFRDKTSTWMTVFSTLVLSKSNYKVLKTPNIYTFGMIYHFSKAVGLCAVICFRNFIM